MDARKQGKGTSRLVSILFTSTPITMRRLAKNFLFFFLLFSGFVFLFCFVCFVTLKKLKQNFCSKKNAFIKSINQQQKRSNQQILMSTHKLVLTESTVNRIAEMCRTLLPVVDKIPSPRHGLYTLCTFPPVPFSKDLHSSTLTYELLAKLMLQFHPYWRDLPRFLLTQAVT
jgi:predicted nucleic acid-binding Zn ribbon protein